MHQLDVFDRKPTPQSVEAIRRRRREEVCAFCLRGKSDNLLTWLLSPESARAVGVPPGRLALITVGFCGPCYGQGGGVARARAYVLRLVADGARARGLPPPQVPWMLVVVDEL